MLNRYTGSTRIEGSNPSLSVDFANSRLFEKSDEGGVMQRALHYVGSIVVVVTDFVCIEQKLRSIKIYEKNSSCLCIILVG